MIGLAVAGVMVGFVLGTIGLMAGPVAMLGLPLALGAAVAAARRPVIAPMLVCAALPVGLVAVVEAPAEVQAIDLAALLAVGSVALPRWFAGRRPLEWHPVMWGYVGLWVVAAAASIGAPDLNAAVNQLVMWALFGLVALTVVTAVRSGDDANWVIGTFLLAGAVVCASALPEAARSRVQFGGGLVVGRPTGIFEQPNELGSFAAAVACLALAAFFLGRPPALRVVAAVAAAMGVGAVALSYSRGAMFGLVLGGLTLIVLMGRDRWRLVVPGLVLAAGLVVLVVSGLAPQRLESVFERIGTVGSGESANPYDDRPAIWAEGVDLIEERPLLGFGPVSFPEVSARAEGPDVWPTTRRPLGKWRLQPGADHAHNTLLTVGAELGVVAMAVVVGTTVAVGVVAVRTVRRRPGPGFRVAVVGGTAALASVVGHGVVDYPFRNPQLWAMVLLLLGIVLAADRWTMPSETAPPPDRSPT